MSEIDDAKYHGATGSALAKATTLLAKATTFSELADVVAHVRAGRTFTPALNINQRQKFISGDMSRGSTHTRSKRTCDVAGFSWTSSGDALFPRQQTTELAALASARVASTSTFVESKSDLGRVLSAVVVALRQVPIRGTGLEIIKLRSPDKISSGGSRKDLGARAPVDQELVTRQRALLARAGGGLTATEVAQRLNVSESDVDELRAAGSLFAVPDPDGPGWTYPALQFEGPRVVSGLCEVLSDFDVKSAWTRLYVLTSKDPALHGRTPIEALKDGDLDPVREIVRGYGQQGGA